MKRPLLCALIYGLLLCFVRFSGVSAETAIPQFELVSDPSLYPGDIYVHNSVMEKTTFLYGFLRIFGGLASNTYFIFLLYTIVNLTHLYLIYKIAELLFPKLKKQNIGLLATLLFLYDSPVFSGAYPQLVSEHSLRQTMFAMPIIAGGIYLFLLGKEIPAFLLLSVIGLSLHFRSTWIFVLVVWCYIFLKRRKYSVEQMILAVAGVSLGIAMIATYRLNCHSTSMDFSQRLEVCDLIIARWKDEGSPFLNSWLDFLRTGAILCPAIYCMRFLGKDHQEKLHLFFGVSLVVFFLGGLYTSFLYKYFPSIEFFSLGFSQIPSYLIILGTILIGGTLWGRSLPPIFGLMYFPRLEMKSLGVFFFCVIVSQAVTKDLKPIAWVFLTAILFLTFRAADRVLLAHKINSPFFPLIVYGQEDRNFYDAQAWARENTSKDSIFLTFKDSDGLVCSDGVFRKYSHRSGYFGDYANFIYDYKLLREHKRRGAVLQDFISSAIVPPEVDYIVLPRNRVADFKNIYSNNGYSIYKP